jgi:8-oxo-dGTP diphosphatase
MIDSSIYGRLVETSADEGIQQLVVGAVVRHGDAVLLLRRPEDDFMGGIFELPSGKVEGEDPRHCSEARGLRRDRSLRVARSRLPRLLRLP